MQDSSPLLHLPSTPSSRHSRHPSLGYLHIPLNSSPLASPTSPKSSPVAAAQARRRSQYKSRVPSTPTSSSSRTFRSSSGARTPGNYRPALPFAGGHTSPAEEPQKTFLRERFKARCFERATKARERAVKGKWWGGSDPSSDGFDDSMDCEEEQDDDDEVVMQDELFRRIMENANRKRRYGYRLSYAYEVGSSVDPDMEDIDRWEHELLDPTASTSSAPLSSTEVYGPPQLIPEDLEDEELEAYAEEYARQAALEDFEGIPLDDLFDRNELGIMTGGISASIPVENSMDVS